MRCVYGIGANARRKSVHTSGRAQLLKWTMGRGVERESNADQGSLENRGFGSGQDVRLGLSTGTRDMRPRPPGKMLTYFRATTASRVI